MSESYRTSDLYYAAYLRVAGVSFLGTEKEQGRVWFRFEATPALRALRDEYYNGEAKVSAFEFAKLIRTHKQLLRS